MAGDARENSKRENKVASARATGTRTIADHTKANVRHAGRRALPYFTSSSAIESATCDAARCCTHMLPGPAHVGHGLERGDVCEVSARVEQRAASSAMRVWGWSRRTR